MTNKQSTQTVQHVFINHDTDLLDVTLTLDPGSQATLHSVTGTSKQQQTAVASHGSHAPPTTKSRTETIHTTQSHPWLTTKGWIKAGKLHLGDQILQLDGTTARVTKLHGVPGVQDMWDLTVSDVHTFAVGDGQWVVHNCNNPLYRGLRSDEDPVTGLFPKDPSADARSSQEVLVKGSIPQRLL